MIAEAAVTAEKSYPSPSPAGAPPSDTARIESARSRRSLMIAKSAGTRCSFARS
jgi:hypothetical protein